jgi:hypothetical protein
LLFAASEPYATDGGETQPRAIMEKIEKAEDGAGSRSVGRSDPQALHTASGNRGTHKYREVPTTVCL